ncbi:hypothetical protein FRC03_009174 [Tulasnella sp. 419]|nr:hypothetical protein FRC03_009174 [Tulasnella sp. 419]
MMRQSSNEHDHRLEAASSMSAVDLTSLADNTSENDDPSFWERYCMEADRHDPQVLERWNRDLDSVLIFVSSLSSLLLFKPLKNPKAGLFSAINTAFIVESYRDLKPSIDSGASDLTNNLLLLILNHMDNSTIGRPDLRPPTLSPDPHSLTVNQLFFSSLLCSLISAFGAVLGKQWLNQFTRMTEGATAEVRGRERQRKWSGLRRWKFETVMEFLPTVLHVSLFFFLIGLIEWLLPLNPAIAYVVLAYSCTGACIYMMTTITAAIYPDSPYQTPTSSYLRRAGKWWKNVGLFWKANLYSLRRSFEHLSWYHIVLLPVFPIIWFTKRLKAVKLPHAHSHSLSEKQERHSAEPRRSRRRRSAHVAKKSRVCHREAIEWLLQVRTNTDTFITAAKAISSLEGTSERWRIIRDSAVLPRLATMIHDHRARSLLHSMIKALSEREFHSTNRMRSDSRDFLKLMTQVLRNSLRTDDLIGSKLVLRAMATHFQVMRSTWGISSNFRWSKYDYALILDFVREQVVDIGDLAAGLTLIREGSVKHKDKFALLREHIPQLPTLVTDSLKDAQEEDHFAHELLRSLSNWLHDNQTNRQLHMDFMTNGLTQTIFRHTACSTHDREEALTFYLDVIEKLCYSDVLHIWAPRLVQDGHFKFLAHILAENHERSHEVILTARSESLFFSLLVEIVGRINDGSLQWDDLGPTVFDDAVATTAGNYRMRYARRWSRAGGDDRLDSIDTYLTAAQVQIPSTPQSLAPEGAGFQYTATAAPGLTIITEESHTPIPS